MFLDIHSRFRTLLGFLCKLLGTDEFLLELRSYRNIAKDCSNGSIIFCHLYKWAVNTLKYEILIFCIVSFPYPLRFKNVCHASKKNIFKNLIILGRKLANYDTLNFIKFQRFLILKTKNLYTDNRLKTRFLSL